jgi:hypothetical protein
MQECWTESGIVFISSGLGRVTKQFASGVNSLEYSDDSCITLATNMRQRMSNIALHDLEMSTTLDSYMRETFVGGGSNTRHGLTAKRGKEPNHTQANSGVSLLSTSLAYWAMTLNRCETFVEAKHPAPGPPDPAGIGQKPVPPHTPSDCSSRVAVNLRRLSGTE